MTYLARLLEKALVPLIRRPLVALAVAVILPASGAIAQAPLADAEREEVAKQIKPVLANPPIDGLLIFHVEPKSQAERAGFQVGDIVTLYDGQPVTTVQQLVQLARRGQEQSQPLADRGSTR